MPQLKLTAERALLEHWPGDELSRKIPPVGREESIPPASYSEYGPDELLLASHQGAFLKPCPATNVYNCCGLWIFHFGLGCNLGCRYCILEAYLGSESLVLFGNVGRGLLEMEELLKKNPSRRPLRFCTGEFTDSLLLDRYTGLSAKLVALFKEASGAVLELKTKTSHIGGLLKLNHGGRTVISFSVNAPFICRTEEGRAAPLEKRLQAAKLLAEAGYPLGLHFDPLVLHPGWEDGYRETLGMISHYLGSAEMAWISLGCFRFLPHLKEQALKKYPQTKMFNPEFIIAADGKARYPRPIRVLMYRFLSRPLQALFPRAALYMCMESPQVWRETFNTDPGREGLKKLLDRRALELSPAA